MRKWVFLAATLVVLFATGLAFWGFRPKEPPGLRRLLTQAGFADIDKRLARIGPEAVPWLIKGLETKDSRFYNVKKSIWRKLPARLQQKWRDYAPVDPATMRTQCAYGLQQFGPEAIEAAPKLIQVAASDSNVFTRQVALSALGAMASRSPDAMQALMRRLREGDSVSRSQVAGVFYWAELAPKAALPIFLAQLENYQQGNPLNEMLAISVYGPEAAPAGPLLVKYITRGEGRGNVMNALKAAGPGALPALPRLLQMLEEEATQPGDASTRQMKPSIFSVIRKMGSDAAPALPALTNALNDANGVVRALAAAGIGNITGDCGFAVPLLVKELENRRFDNDDVFFSFRQRHAGGLGLNQRQLAAMLLGEIGPPATNALPNLKRALKSGDLWLPAFAAEAIWRISSDGEAILPSLIASINHQDDSRKILTLHVLKAMGPPARSAVPAIRGTMEGDMKVRREAFEALEKIEGRQTLQQQKH